MPLPTLLCLGLASAVAAALAGRAELRVSPRPPLLTRSFFAWLAFACLVLVPTSIYFYAFHGDWFLLYLIDVRRIPSAVAMVGFAVEVAIGAAGFVLGAALVRAQREGLGGGVAALFVLLGLSVVLVAADRLSVVGSYAEFKGGFGLESFGSGALFQGTLAMSALFLVGGGYLLMRLWIGSKRG